jgi:hypothetical protein
MAKIKEQVGDITQTLASLQTAMQSVQHTLTAIANQAPTETAVPSLKKGKGHYTPGRANEPKPKPIDTVTLPTQATPEEEAIESASLYAKYPDVLTAYPKILEWMTAGEMSLSVEQMVAATNLSFQKVRYHAKNTLRRTSANPNLYTLASILPWLKKQMPPVTLMKQAQADTPTSDQAEDTPTHQSGHKRHSDTEPLHTPVSTGQETEAAD